MRTVAIAVVGIALSGIVVAAQTGDAKQGAATYVEKKCNQCHKTTKTDEKGGKLSTVLADTVGKLSADDIKSWLTEPAKMEAKLPKKPLVPMSAFLKTAKLTPVEIANLVAYVQTLPGK